MRVGDMEMALGVKEEGGRRPGGEGEMKDDEG